MASQESFQAGAEGKDAASLAPFFLSCRLMFEAREAGSRVHMGGSNCGWRKSLCQMRAWQGMGAGMAKGVHSTWPLGTTCGFTQEKGLLGCTKIGTH